MQEPTSGLRGTPKNTEFPIVDLAVTAAVVDYVAEAIVWRAGVPHLLIPTNRKRRRPIVIHVTNELLCRLMELRGSPEGSYTYLQECNQRQSDIILEKMERLREAQDQNTDLNERLAHLQDAYVERGEELAVVKQEANALAEAIQKTLNPSNAAAAWQTVHVAFRKGLQDSFFHPRSTHPWWSWRRWIGCPDCAPNWMFLDPEDSSIRGIPAYVAKSVYRKVLETLKPALVGDDPCPKSAKVNLLQSPEAAKSVVDAPGANRTADVDVSITG